MYRFTADLVLVLHLAFVGFVVLGALLVVRWPKIMPFHIAAVVWGVLIELTGFICPLTPLEVKLRTLGGEAGYSGGFVEHYVVSVLYPSGLTRGVQMWLGLGALVINVVAYAYVFARRGRERPL